MEFLEDRKNNKMVPWRAKKIRALLIADSYQRLDLKKKASRIRFCGSFLEFEENIETKEMKLHSADFCRDRLCPMCQWRRSLKVFSQVSKVMDKVQEKYPHLYVPIFLTLTVKNCKGNELTKTLDLIFKSYTKLIRKSKVKRNVKGAFRSLEVTYNKEEDTFHPHIHAIMFVDKNYFYKSNKDYLKTEDWVKIWRSCLNVDYDPVCYVERVQCKNKRYKAVSEVAKYALKDTDFIFKNEPELTDKLVSILSTSLAGKRLFSFSGILKDIAKELNLEELGDGDLVHIDDDNLVREDVAKVIKIYKWSFGLGNYLLTK